MNKTSTAGLRRHPALRPLTCGVLLALATLPMSTLMAGNLDGTEQTIDEHHAHEAWFLQNNARLVVNNGNTWLITAVDSAVELNGATVTRVNPALSHALELRGESTGTANGSTFIDGGVYVSGNSHLTLTGSSITVDENAPGMDNNSMVAYGITLGEAAQNGVPTMVLDASTVRVADRADLANYGGGIGAYLRAGQLALLNNSLIDADNIGVVMHNHDPLMHRMELELDNSHIKSGRGAGIEVVAQNTADNDIDITVANGSTIDAGDGNILLVHAFNGVPTTSNTDVRFIVDNSALEGNIVFDDSNMLGNVHVLLRNNASLKGVLDNATSAGISHSTWTLTGDSSVGRLILANAGTVDLGGNGTRFNTLTLDSFLGGGGTLVFNTQLEGDASLTDKLHIIGDATGHASVRVNGVGGQGAQTDQGIELIVIDGDSDADFVLQGRAVGGLYEYNKLLKDDNGNWYLHSQLEDGTEPDLCAIDPSTPDCVTLPVLPGDPENPDPEQPDPEQPDPEEPGKPGPVLRPETGAYLANQAAMDALLRHSARDRMSGATATDGVRTWATTRHGESRMDVTGQQTLRTTQSSLQVGADMGVFDGGNGRVGVMLSAGQANATARSTVTGYRAEGTVEGGAAGVYSHWSNTATWLDASVQAGRFSNRVEGEGLAAERYDASVMQASLEAGHRFDVGQIGRMALSLQPEVQLTYSAVRMDQHVESNGTVITRDGGNGVSARVGVRLEGEAAMATGHFRPYVALHGYHDARRNALSFDGVRIEGALPATRVELSAGGQVQFGRGLSGFGGVSASQGEDGYRDVGAKVGLTYRW